MRVTHRACEVSMLYVWDTHKGLVFTADRCRAPKDELVGCGLELLNWAPHLPEACESEPSLESSEYTEANPVKKRKEKREEKRAKKAALKEAKRGKEIAQLSGGLNPYLALKELKDIYKQISDKSKGDAKLFQFKLIAFYNSDANHLVPGEWLNDNNISFIYELVQEFFLKPKDLGFHIHLLYPAVVQLLMHYPAQQDLKDMLPMDDLRKLKLVFIPFNFMEDCDYVNLEDANNGDHWALCVLSIPEKKIFVYDSMAFDADAESDKLLGKLALRIAKIMFKSNTKVQIVKKNCDQQENFDDCGVFLVMLSCLLISELLLGEPTDLDVSKVKLEPTCGRLEIMKLAQRFFLAKPKT